MCKGCGIVYFKYVTTVRLHGKKCEELEFLSKRLLKYRGEVSYSWTGCLWFTGTDVVSQREVTAAKRGI